VIHKRLAPLLVVLLLGLAFSASAQAGGGTAMVWGYNAAAGAPGGGALGCEDCIDVPAPLNGIAGAVQMSGGYQHGLALLDDGTVMAWGRNSDGQLGDGTTDQRTAPGPVPGLSGVVALATGEDTSLALLADGTVRAWGSNEEGFLGDGGTTGPEDCGGDPCSKVPIAVPGVAEVIAIAAADEFALALRSDGTVLAWGKNQYGTLGDGIGKADPAVRQIAGLAGVVAISAGENGAMALLADGTTRVWGYNREGELGTGISSTNAPCYCLAPTSPTAVSGVRQVAAGGGHYLALLSSGAVMGWGLNEAGQVGLGFASEGGCTCVTTPTLVPALAPESIAATYETSLALLADGTGRSFGYGYYGELGNGESGDDVESTSPIPILNLSGASEIAKTVLGAYAIIGPKQALKVEIAGAGTGGVGGNNIACPPSCTSTPPQGRVEALRATPDPGTGFAGFTGACTGTGACQVKMSGDQTVTATFGAPKGTKITKAKIKGKKKKKATFSFSAPGVVTGYECKLVKPKPKKAKKKKKKAKFSRCAKPKVYKNLKPGRYRFEVRARNALGIEAVPAKRKFKVKRAKAKKRRA